MVLALALHQIVRESAQVGQDQCEKLVFSLSIPRSPLVQKFRDVSHGQLHRASADVADPTTSIQDFAGSVG
jgi:hypothetical protein